MYTITNFSIDKKKDKSCISTIKRLILSEKYSFHIYVTSLYRKERENSYMCKLFMYTYIHNNICI